MAEGLSVASGRASAPTDGAASDESLSALLDDEAQDLEVRRVLRDMGAQSAVRDRWYRYQLIRSALHGEELRDAPDFVLSVRNAIAHEPALGVASRGGWRRTLGSLAVAASVATVVVFGGQQLAVTAGGDAANTVVRVGPMPVGVVNTVGAVPVQASFGTRALPTLQPADRTAYRELARQRLKRFSQEHAEHASLNTPEGMLPFARVPEIQR